MEASALQQSLRLIQQLCPMVFLPVSLFTEALGLAPLHNGATVPCYQTAGEQYKMYKVVNNMEIIRVTVNKI